MTTMTTVKQQVESLIEVLNNEWKVNSIESGHSVYTQLEYTVGRRYIKVVSYLSDDGDRMRGNSVWMFVDKNTGECYKPASWNAPAIHVRYLITELADHSDICDPYGSFLYL